MSIGGSSTPNTSRDFTGWLGGQPGDDVIDLLDRDWSGPASFNLERALHDPPFPIQLHIR